MCSLTVAILVAFIPTRLEIFFGVWVVVLFGSFAGSRVLLALSEHRTGQNPVILETDPRLGMT